MIGYHYDFGEEEQTTNQDVIQYLVSSITEYRQKGMSDTEIRTMFSQYGEDPTLVDAAFAQLNAMQKSDEGKSGNGKTASKPMWFWPAVIGGSAVGLFAIWKMVKR